MNSTIICALKDIECRRPACAGGVCQAERAEERYRRDYPPTNPTPPADQKEPAQVLYEAIGPATPWDQASEFNKALYRRGVAALATAGKVTAGDLSWISALMSRAIPPESPTASEFERADRKMAQEAATRILAALRTGSPK